MSPAQASLQLARSRLHDGYQRINPWLNGELRSTVPHTVLHTFSHLLIKEFALISGFSLGSIRERLYLDMDEHRVQSAGILLYTSGASSDGTLGGLVQQGPPLNGWNRRSQAPSTTHGMLQRPCLL